MGHDDEIADTSQYSWLKPCCCLLSYCFFTSSAFGKRKDDVVIMKNGDKFTGETEPVLNSAEVLLGLKFSTFRFKTLNVTSETFLFPGLTDLGRVRLSSRANLRIEFLRNFYWNFQFLRKLR